MVSSSMFLSIPKTGTDLSSAFVYGCKGLSNICWSDPNSTILPTAVAALRHALDNGLPLPVGLEICVQAAEEGARATIPLVARKGRASYLGERSAGHQDPGATSTYLILSALLDAVQ